MAWARGQGRQGMVACQRFSFTDGLVDAGPLIYGPGAALKLAEDLRRLFGLC